MLQDFTRFRTLIKNSSQIALPAAAEQLLLNPRSRPKIEPNFEVLSWFFQQGKAHKTSYEPGGLINALVSGKSKV